MTQVINLRVIRDDGIGRVGALIRLHRKASFEAVRGAHFRFVVLLADFVVTAIESGGWGTGRGSDGQKMRKLARHCTEPTKARTVERGRKQSSKPTSDGGPRQPMHAIGTRRDRSGGFQAYVHVLADISFSDIRAFRGGLF